MEHAYNSSVSALGEEGQQFKQNKTTHTQSHDAAGWLWLQQRGLSANLKEAHGTKAPKKTVITEGS